MSTIVVLALHSYFCSLISENELTECCLFYCYQADNASVNWKTEPKGDKQREVTRAEWSATWGHINDGAKQSRAVCSEPTLAEGHQKPLDCVCDGDRQNRAKFPITSCGKRGGSQEALRGATTSSSKQLTH